MTDFISTDLLITLTCASLILFAVWDYLRRWVDHQEREAQVRSVEQEAERLRREIRQADLQRRYWDACVTPHKYEPPETLTPPNPYLYSEPIWPDDELWPEKTKEA